ncbi:MAG: hypothetical protein R3332_02070 [Pseudohongiellaceae bacterium]|nr:hypothetical protein [Pseudohongiellaceae bacterium]
MLDLSDYLIGWGVYIAAGITCYMVFYRFTGAISYKPLANCLRAFMLALMFTPWYVAPDQDLMAPALMVILLDMVTVGGTSFVRALVPLVLAIVVALLIALTGRFFKRLFQKK